MVTSIEQLLQTWPDNFDIPEMIPATMRRVMIIHHNWKMIYQCRVEFFVPEVWDLYQELKHLVNNLLGNVIACAAEKLPRSSVRSLLYTLLVQLRWTLSQLFYIQRKEVCKFKFKFSFYYFLFFFFLFIYINK
jgi:hypothetical protein